MHYGLLVKSLPVKNVPQAIIYATDQGNSRFMLENLCRKKLMANAEDTQHGDWR